ncbi:UDP-N-acetylmuramate--L-alanine ligase [Pseudobacter ginsenosidimutans]|uniref:UDP-N-acetylmuramate: L-alanyl-gamma-D-glutamyl-meso-diaminopimelate ligase n=1 Tax=Pseudobacter ginsenosidimutans TaxID=661488 RepID=A0A4Q7MJK7_9BACT|nr:Mur ligase family protein [Pseudobacter ginsenosidimutans]QEC45414.1 peptidoglycan synthetase [Pseudobacter ginsenosidimutans]RZS66942.1 UDP-N-acetylmuramate: L-alanyl-gamma-D-glutamyl-meso-diaminopimelate ligase [Pseudobacter ginsenosidimutans]
MNVHFIAIGGSVMHQLALALHKKGYRVTGSDDEIFEPALGNLRLAGILPDAMGWFPEKIQPGLDAVILGMHAKPDNPELLRAKELDLTIYSFPEYIYQESIEKTRVVVGGSHGKTTTTAMIMHVLNKTGKDFDYLVGARLEGFEQSVRITDAPILVAEGDEYPASVIEKRPKFHFLFPQIAIITGIAWDHINVFPTFEIYLEQFTIYIDKIEKGGILIYNESDPVLKELVEKHARKDIRYQPYGIPPHTIHDGATTVTIDGVSTILQVFGDHNLLNMHAAWYACDELGVDADAFTKAIASFTGASKRLELMAKNEQTAVYRDFAHAPSKVKATIDAVKQQYPHRTLIAVLELHTFSSLNEKFMDQYHGAMDKADKAVVYYSNHALELKRLPPLDPARIREGFGKEGLVVMNNRNDLMKWMEEQEYQHSNLLLMSSGNYDGADMLTFAKNVVEKI